jgi:hypothetical protein
MCYLFSPDVMNCDNLMCRCVGQCRHRYDAHVAILRSALAGLPLHCLDLVRAMGRPTIPHSSFTQGPSLPDYNMYTYVPSFSPSLPPPFLTATDSSYVDSSLLSTSTMTLPLSPTSTSLTCIRR